MVNPTPRRFGRGFTLIEFGVVMAITAIVAAITLGYLNRSKAPHLFSNTVVEVASAIRRARAESLARGVTVAFLVDTVGKRWWIIESPAGPINVATVNPANLNPWTTTLPMIAYGSLPREVQFGPIGGYGVAPPAPFAGVPVTLGAGVNFAYCSFCISGANNGYGAINFQPGGQVVFSGGPPGIGQQLTMAGTIPTEVGNRTVLVAVVQRTGTTAVFER